MNFNDLFIYHQYRIKQQERADEYRNEVEAMKRRVQARALIVEQQEMLIKMQRFERKYKETIMGTRSKTQKQTSKTEANNDSLFISDSADKGKEEDDNEGDDNEDSDNNNGDDDDDDVDYYEGSNDSDDNDGDDNYDDDGDNDGGGSDDDEDEESESENDSFEEISISGSKNSTSSLEN
ncbi:hypothetical protein LOAG_14634 [Loa loa]|uniref:Uncharacterized protein n=1 Tax=Loa loa TaxID=7209 RepID=A0A1S0THX5_LOALO|nr:hypothetical protein LOAG_14634 [Loa loa]EFO13893.1 hypothetical protein LOAG_14634 [Loa loa]